MSIAAARGLQILRFDEIAAQDDVWPQIADIFFASTNRADLDTDAVRSCHLDRWTRYYRVVEPDLLFVARQPEGSIAGYLTGCRDSAAATGRGLDLPGYAMFERWFRRFPAHFHINCHPVCRGGGIGQRLINRLRAALRTRRVPGVHVVTALGARNVGFYHRCGFRPIAVRPFGDRRLILLGQRL